ncbi:MAG TPA: hypothetical protein VIE43_04485 [Thermoanaerobaculia bacterium]|jgi:hypothetical protein|nr:hypothetical protein [Thermoanaerobaculia bacterium]
MQPLIVESRFCRFHAPWNWTPAPGLGAIHERKPGAARSALVVENWLEKPKTAAEYAAVQQEMLLTHDPRIQLLDQRPVASRDWGDAHFCIFKIPGEAKADLRQEQLTVTNGPLVCSLTLTASASDSEAWEEIFPETLRSFEVPARSWAAVIRREPLAMVPPTRLEGKAEALQLAYPVRPGWTFDADQNCLRHASGSEITLRRSGLSSDAPDALFAEALARVGKTSSYVPRAWDKGVTPTSFPFYALESTSTTRKTWGQPEIMILREAFLRDESVLKIQLTCRDGDAEALAAFGELVLSYTLLPPEQRKLRVQSPWIDLHLQGPWTEVTPGAYLRQLDSILFLTVRSLQNTQGRLRHGQSAIERVKARPDLRQISKEESADGQWKGWDAYRHAIDFTASNERASSYRASWFELGKDLHEITLLGPTARETEEIFLEALQAVRPSGTPPKPGRS